MELKEKMEKQYNEQRAKEMKSCYFVKIIIDIDNFSIFINLILQVHRA